MSRPPLVTVGLPVHNGARYLDIAVRSILNQDIEDLELVIADNGSTDATGDICAAHASVDRRVRILTSPANRGAAWNYSRLVANARGTFFKWAAHDDVLREDFLSRCLYVLEHEQDAVLCHTWAIGIDSEGRKARLHRPADYAGQCGAAVRVRDVLRNGPQGFECFGLIRREALSRTSLIGPYVGSNRVLLTQLAALGRFRLVPHDVLMHRDHEARSERAFPGLRDRNAWFSPASGPARFPRGRVLRHQVRSVAGAPLPLADRLLSAPGLLSAAQREFGSWLHDVGQERGRPRHRAHLLRLSSTRTSRR